MPPICVCTNFSGFVWLSVHCFLREQSKIFSLDWRSFYRTKRKGFFGQEEDARQLSRLIFLSWQRKKTNKSCYELLLFKTSINYVVIKVENSFINGGRISEEIYCQNMLGNYFFAHRWTFLLLEKNQRFAFFLDYHDSPTPCGSRKISWGNEGALWLERKLEKKAHKSFLIRFSLSRLFSSSRRPAIKDKNHLNDFCFSSFLSC